LTPETLITNFLSNKAYFAKYSNKVYGLSGTLGSKATKGMLKAIYNVDFVIMPRYQNRSFQEIEAKLIDMRSDWQKAIVNSVLQEAEGGRGVLIVCETILNAEEIKREIKSECNKGEICAKYIPI
jgi:preprotein translocase subunit SecA